MSFRIIFCAYSFFTLFNLFYKNLYALGNNKIDSLETMLKIAKVDTEKINLLIEISNLYNYENPYKGLQYAERAFSLAEKQDASIWKAKCLESLGENHMDLGNYEKTIETQQAALVIYESLKNDKGKANCYNTLGQTYNYKGEYSKAIEYHLKALAIREKLNDKKQISGSFNNLGFVYYMTENFPMALEYFQKSLKIDEERGDSIGISKMLNNIGVMYDKQEKYDEALVNFNRSLLIKNEIGDKLGMANTQGNIGGIYLYKKENETALSYYMMAMQLHKELNNTGGISNMYISIGRLYFDQKKHDKSIAYTDSSIALAKAAGIKKSVSDGYAQLSIIYAAVSDFKKAYEYHKIHSETKDSLLNEESSKQIAEMQTIYETDKKEKQIEIQNLQITAQDAELNKKQITIYASIGGLLLMLLLAVFIYRSYRQKQKANILLGEKNELIEKQKAIVEEKNKDITASIRYAERIQRAILPADSILQKALPNSFVYYAPRDIVSGDFYWLHQHNGSVFIAACDCTGHGVPGALMSMIGKDQINHVVVEKNILSTSEILSHLNRGIKNALQQGEQDELVQDGMEIALLKINADKKEVSFSGANRPLFLVRESGAEEILLDKFPIGGHTEDGYLFRAQNIQTNDSDMLYIFSDGYADQFGGQKGKKFTTKKLKDLLISIAPMPVNEQSRELRKTFENWKGSLEQVDDVLVIGIRV